MHYVWLDWGGEGDKHPGRMREREPKHRGKTRLPKANRRDRGKHPHKMKSAKAGIAAKRQSAWRGGSPGLAKAGTAAKRQSSDRGKNTYGVARGGSRGGENEETRKRGSRQKRFGRGAADRPGSPKRGPRQNAKAATAAVRLALYRGVLRLWGK